LDRGTGKVTPSRKQERAAAKRFQGRITPASGSRHLKGDVLSRRFLIECKTTSKRSIALNRDWIDKMIEYTSGDGRIPILEIEFQESATHSRRLLYVVCADDFDFLVEDCLQ
jgi:Holliday junction resolvase